METPESAGISANSVPNTIETPKFGVEYLRQPQTEDDLCDHLKGMRVNEIKGGIWLKWHAGNFIRGFYKAEKAYGKDELGKIAKKTGWSHSSLQKACQFAEKYNPDQVEALSRGRFQLAWRDISQNLCLEPQALIDAYLGAETPKQFRNAVIQLRQPLQGGTPPPKPKTRKELERDLSERDQKIAYLENRIQALEAKIDGLTSSDELVETQQFESEVDLVGDDDQHVEPVISLEEMISA